MLQVEIEPDEPCGTPLCHAGWYSVARAPLRKDADWQDVADLLARDLGFAGFRALLHWAHTNADIWGNKYGGSMFDSAHAFDVDPDSPLKARMTLHDIIAHWEGVRDRALQAG